MRPPEGTEIPPSSVGIAEWRRYGCRNLRLCDRFGQTVPDTSLPTPPPWPGGGGHISDTVTCRPVRRVVCRGRSWSRHSASKILGLRHPHSKHLGAGQLRCSSSSPRHMRHRCSGWCISDQCYTACPSTEVFMRGYPVTLCKLQRDGQ